MTQIDWGGKGLNGVINGTAIPSSMIILRLNNNAIIGSITNALPDGLLYLYLYGNQMSGDLPSFPNTLTRLVLGYPGYPGNRFTGTLILNQPIQLYINDNWITDVVIRDSSVLATGGYLCDLSNTPLLGNQNIAELTICTKNGLYSAALLPVTRSMTTLTKPTRDLGTTIAVTSATLDGTTAMEMTTNFGRTTVHQTSSSEMESGRMLSSVMLVTGTRTDTSTSSMGTVAILQELSDFAVKLGMMVRVVISGMLLTYVLSRTPFNREFKKMMSKGKTTTATSRLEF